MIARRGVNGPKVSEIKGYLIKLGYPLNDSGPNQGVFGPKMEAAVEDFQEKHNLAATGEVDETTYTQLVAWAKDADRKPVLPVNPAYNEAKKYAGKSEYDKKFGPWLAGFWSKAGLPGYKTIIGSAFAWCGLFLLAMNTQVGQKYIAGAAGARNWAKYGVEIDYKKNGAPRGAVVHINHGFNCNSASGNHVAFLDGDCTALDMTKKGGTIPLYGGNQSDKVKRSTFSNREICEVRWPAEVELPGKVEKSVDCGGQSGSSESTR